MSATTSPKVIEEIIRGRIGFDGLLMSDDSSMNALKGTLGERAANIVAGGCDIVLHCNGVMGEMLQVVKEVPVLSGRSLERVRAVEGAPDMDMAGPYGKGRTTGFNLRRFHNGLRRMQAITGAAPRWS